MMIYTLESKVQLWPICCVIRGLFAECLHFLLLVATIRMYYFTAIWNIDVGREGPKGSWPPQMKQICCQFMNISLDS